MGRSRILAAAGVAALPLAVACTSLVGLDDFEKAQCPGAVCTEAGTGEADTVDGGPDVRIDGQGAAPVQWARWRMPNHPLPDAATVNPNPASYTDDAEIVRDSVTSLTWQKAQVAGQTYAQAKAACDALTLGGSSSWRLPSRIELVTLLDLGKQPRIDPRFTGTTPTPYWSSSEVRPFVAAGNPQYWAVDFGDGNVKKTPATSVASVRCVKGGP